MAAGSGPWSEGACLAEPGDAVLEARDLACLRGERVVFAGLSLALPAGCALVLTGANGTGKSTLLRILSSLLRPAEGVVLWRGKDIAADAAAHAARLRYLSHQDGVKPALTVTENLAFFAALWGGDVAAALDAMALTALEALPARVLSSGQKRRLALARLALAPVPLWLLDEPTTGLDAASVERLGPMLAAHRAAGGIVVAATHVPLPLPDARELRL
jgi:heme exporter protein A